LALIRGSQAIHGASAGVRRVEEGAVWGYAAHQKAQCGVRSAEEGTVRRYAGSRRSSCEGTQTRRQYGAYLHRGTQSRRRVKCRPVQSRHRRTTDMRRFILVKVAGLFLKYLLAVFYL